MRILSAALTAIGLTLASPPASARDFTPYTPASLDRALRSEEHTSELQSL